MLKISIQIDAGHFPEGAFQFARQLNEVVPLSLTGSFLMQSDFVNLWNPGPLIAMPERPFADEHELSEESIQRFKSECEGSHLSYHIHSYLHTLGFPELEKQSRFSDALLVGSEVFFKNISEKLPNEYLRDLLHIAECPVIIVPESFVFPSTIVLAYDGSESSVYAIRQFALLFPELSDKKTILVYSGDAENQIPDLEYINEFAACHFNNYGTAKIVGSGRRAFSEWLSGIEHPLLVSGAFGRAELYEALRKSFVTDVIHEHKAIVFIAHK